MADPIYTVNALNAATAKINADVQAQTHPHTQDTAALVAEAVERLRYQTGIDQSWTLLSDIVSAVRRDERARCREVVEASCEHSMLNATMSGGAKERAIDALDARGEVPDHA